MKCCWALIVMMLFAGCQKDDEPPLEEKVVGVLADLAVKDLEKRLEKEGQPKVACKVMVEPSQKRMVMKKARRLDLTPFGFKVGMKIPKGATVESLPRMFETSPPSVRVRRGLDDQENLVPTSEKAFRLILKTAGEKEDHDKTALVKDLNEMTKELGGKLAVVRDHQDERGWELIYSIVEEPDTPPNWTTAVWRSDLGLACGSFMHFEKKQIENVLQMCRSLEPL